MKAPLTIILFSAASLAATACNSKEEAGSASTKAPAVTEPGSPAAKPAAEPPRAQPAAGLDDAAIAAIVVAANQVDIDAGKLAIEKSKNPEVKKFAGRMVTDHTAVNKAAVELVTRLGVTPKESDVSKSLATGGADTRAKLEKLDGDAFDRAYVDNEVAYHEAVIGVLKTQLIPSATNADLRAALVGAQPAFEAHLQHARQIQSALASGSKVEHDHGSK